MNNSNGVEVDDVQAKIVKIQGWYNAVKSGQQIFYKHLHSSLAKGAV